MKTRFRTRTLFRKDKQGVINDALIQYAKTPFTQKQAIEIDGTPAYWGYVSQYAYTLTCDFWLILFRIEWYGKSHRQPTEWER